MRSKLERRKRNCTKRIIKNWEKNFCKSITFMEFLVLEETFLEQAYFLHG